MKRRFTEDSWRKEPWFRGLVGAIRACKTEAEIENFLRDIGTLSELQAWSERLEVARLLSRGLSYRQVAAQTDASTTTVTRVAHFLENGEGGYRHVLRSHRHHRMQIGPKTTQEPPVMEMQPETASTEQPEPRKISPLQKYLDR
ncbi:MAG TPA: YerC/YecD family TrpR-related protein [Candidatus Peribacteraceae bacterium]|nr:YerC/YecD family TrpR-related protein [Candidatus Peribacteraceae bacterium]